MIILDIRVPSLPCAVLDGHSACVNSLAWAPHSSCHICTAGDDNQALIWDLASLGSKQIEEPILAYYADTEINQLQWYAEIRSSRSRLRSPLTSDLSARLDLDRVALVLLQLPWAASVARAGHSAHNSS